MQQQFDQLDRVEVILVSPRNPLNIGAAARAMANFGFSHLTVVAPHEPLWREAKSAIGASDLLQKARCTQYLADAIADCTLVLGTASLTHREPEQPIIELPGITQLIGQELVRGGRIALVFGPEKRGLTREDLSYCHRLLTIPADSVQPSMNLGQAVAVCLYEVSSRLQTPQSLAPQAPEQAAATATQLEQLAGVIDAVMQAAEYSPDNMRAANRHDTHLLLRRLTFTERDARRTLGFFRRILWRLRH